MKVAVIYGGKSAERAVSLMSGKAVAEALEETGHAVKLLDLTDSFFGDLQAFHPDVVFIGLHGRMGEDGTVQGALELLGYPYVGSGVLASAIAIDKRMTKRLLATAGVPVARDDVLTKGKTMPNTALAQHLGDVLGWPYIIKPNREGSTIGLTLAHDPDEAVTGMQTALACDVEVLVEEYLKGTEVTVVVVGEPDQPQVLGVIEIIPRAELYDYESKYSIGGSEHIIPARINAQLLREVEEYAKVAYQTVGCRDYARVDFIVGDAGCAVLEVNTLPGMTSTSLVPDAAKAQGISFAVFLDRLVQGVYHRNTTTQQPSEG